MNKFRSLNSPYNSLGHSLQRVHCIILLKENLDESKCFKMVFFLITINVLSFGQLE